MLHKETVSPESLERLTELMKDEHLSDFLLVGGTALSLQIGHRKSFDFEFFSEKPFDEIHLLEYLEARWAFKLNFQNKNTLKGEVDKIQMDFITHAYPQVKPFIDIDGIRLSSIQDISAMKLNAIIGSGTRLKDFVDVACLSSHISLKEMIESYETKYTSRNPLMVLKSLDFTEDINKSEIIELINREYSWESTKKRLTEMIKVPSMIFESSPFRLSQGPRLDKSEGLELKKGRRI